MTLEPERADETAPASALAVFAHPDDAEMACGATLARWAANGASVVIATVARGDKGATVRREAEELVAVRAAEADTAGRILGVAERRGLGRSDGEFDNDVALRRDLVELIRELGPQVVITSDPTAVFYGSHVNHRDHRECGWAVLDAVAPAVSMPLYFPDAGDPHTVDELWLSSSPQPDHFVEVGDWLDHKAAALSAHRSQVLGGLELGSAMADDEAVESVAVALRRLVEHRAAEEGQPIGRPAEAFRRLVL